MILGPVSFLDCLVFLFFLAPNLLINVGLWDIITCVVKAAPFLLLKLPLSFIYEHYLTRRENQTLFIQKASTFEDVVIRCVRYAFANIPAKIGRVLFSKAVALPFMRFRMLRHGYLKSPVHWEEVSRDNVKGIWMIHDSTAKPDMIIYYVHGGGFAMGSPYFYLEFLITLLTYLKSPTHPNPAIFALTYTLVPDAHYPTQINEALAGYKHILPLISNDSSKICFAGDSAGTTILLSLLLLLSNPQTNNSHPPSSPSPITEHKSLGIPALASFISPWTEIHSPLHKNLPTDYLNVTSLNLYATQYLSTSSPSPTPFPAPLPSSALPPHGIQILYSPTELFAPSIKTFITTLQETYTSKPRNKREEASENGKGRLNLVEEIGGMHAWVIADIFLKTSREDRVRGVKKMAEWIRENISSSSS